MKPRLTILAAAVLAIGCFAHPASGARPSRSGATSAIVPSAEEISLAFYQYALLLACPEGGLCNPPGRLPVDSDRCGPSTTGPEVRCRFALTERSYQSTHVYLCAGLFRTDRNGWYIVRLRDGCLHSWPAS